MVKVKCYHNTTAGDYHIFILIAFTHTNEQKFTVIDGFNCDLSVAGLRVAIYLTPQINFQIHTSFNDLIILTTVVGLYTSGESNRFILRILA